MPRPVILLTMTSVEFWTDGEHDGWVEYQELRANLPAAARVVRDAITLITDDQDRARREYSIVLDRRDRYLGLPFLGPDGLTCLTWRQDPDGYDCVQIVDFSAPWADLPMPRVWPRPDRDAGALGGGGQCSSSAL